MSGFNYDEGGQVPDNKGVRVYMTCGIVLLVCSSVATTIAAEMMNGGAVNLAQVLGGGSRGFNLWPVTLVFWGNIFLYLGTGIVLLSVLFDLFHRYRATGPRDAV